MNFLVRKGEICYLIPSFNKYFLQSKREKLRRKDYAGNDRMRQYERRKICILRSVLAKKDDLLRGWGTQR